MRQETSCSRALGIRGRSRLGYVCCLAPEGTARKIADGLYFPNGLALLGGGETLVVAETYSHRLWKGRWDARTCGERYANPIL